MSHSQTRPEIAASLKTVKLDLNPVISLQFSYVKTDKWLMNAVATKEKRAVHDLDISDLGVPDSFRYNVLTFVVNEEYDRAINHLKEFLARDSEYQNFRERIDRYINHAIDLIFAIRTKRNFPGMSLLSKTKQNELREKYRDHFQELKTVMRKVENCQEELRLSDIKSTTMLVRSMWFSVCVVVISAVVIEIAQGLGSTFFLVFDDYLNKALEYIFKLLNIQ